MWAYEDSRSAVRDALRLSRAMTFKNAVADLPLGGGKGVIMLNPGERVDPRRRRKALQDFGETVERLAGTYVTAEDVGTSAKDMTIIAKHTQHVSGLSRRQGGSGDPSSFTAQGVLHAIEATCERVFGSPDLKQRSVAVVGLGHVGLKLAQLLAKEGATLVVSDIDASKKVEAAALDARWIAPTRALQAPVDVLAPCALGGILDHETVPALQSPAIVGAANNQLAEDGIAELLQRHGVLWAPDFVANAGGIINISVEFEPGGYNPERAKLKTRRIADTLRKVFDDAQARRMTPLAAAMDLARERLSPRRAPRRQARR